MHSFMLKITLAPVAVHGNLCNLIIYYITKPPELDWRVDSIKRDRGHMSTLHNKQ